MVTMYYFNCRGVYKYLRGITTAFGLLVWRAFGCPGFGVVGRGLNPKP